MRIVAANNSTLAETLCPDIVTSMKNVVEPPLIPLRGGQLWPLSVAAYHVLGEAGLIPKNTELLYGFVYKKTSKSPFHSFLVARLLRLLQPAIPPTHMLRSEQPITCLDSEPEPDISVVRGTEGDFLDGHPRTAELVIDVCVTSHDYDHSKLRAHASAGVKECWCVLGPEQKIEVHRRPNDGQFAEQAVHGPGSNLTTNLLPDLMLSVDAIFAK